mmetsp:Transcript_14869/g.41799  ORF Transcript_14869/g.41799 Transcript_14869/m.41799 type:complete len:239 (-) Transcript_14869:112-828(-)|eukprot:CAMPEP_0117668958 /NCGR_PEP_ID=MMETSP0804-20121206/11850_1 /TAXON_ID=1074897 /ORGANISM="Tetraselmis astigmatica, Strain CCMP880" /LENGTH=238 /DNA_ID=CAMNT_0005476931 /DNA_START=220 /DNA_END=936 /DNA_ORIENTATION=-
MAKLLQPPSAAVPQGTIRSGGQRAVVLCRSSGEATPSPPARRIVALHGKGDDGERMREGLQPLIDSTSPGGWEWICPTAPHKIRGGYAWWLTEPGVRSFEATEWPGMEHSISMIEDLYPFDALLGYSQGAMLSAVLLARAQRGQGPAKVPAVIGGAAWPLPYEDLLNHLPQSGMPPTLHTIGSQDDVNPPIMALRVADCFGEMAHVLNHNGGHWIPMNDPHLEEIRNFILNIHKSEGS